MNNEKFMSLVNIQGPDDCWPWLGMTNGRYGRAEYEGRLQQAHRISYKIHCEPVVDEIKVLHHCDNPICVNPKHLFLGSQQDNVDDMIAKGRDCFGDKRPQIGSNHGGAILNEDKVREIKRLLEEGHQHKDIAEWFDVKRQTITNIAMGTRWRHV